MNLTPIRLRPIARRHHKNVGLKLSVLSALDRPDCNHLRVRADGIREHNRETRRNYLVVPRRRGSHEQNTLEQLVTVSVVGEIVEHVDRKTRNRKHHEHSLNPRQGRTQACIAA